MENEEKNKAVLLPDNLYDKLKKEASAAGINSVEEYVIYILKELLKEKAGEESEVSEEEVKTRLKALGYLD